MQNFENTIFHHGRAKFLKKELFQSEEVAGAPLMCQAAGEWHLVGVAAWRKGCSVIAQRPRLYDKVSPNSVWARNTMDEMDKKSKNVDDTRIPKKTGNGNG